MQFNSFIFILVFLPVTVLAYYLANRINYTLGKIILVAAGMIFYAYSDIKTALVFLLSILINYTFTVLIVKKKMKLYVSVPVVINVLLLIIFKYTGFLLHNVNRFLKADLPMVSLALPVGISFFTFQQIAYIVSVYRGEIDRPVFLDYLAYILYFPKLLMGPLVEPADFLTQLNDVKKKSPDWDNIACGIKIFSFGLFKKVMIADVLAVPVSWAYGNIGEATAMDWIMVMLFYTFEIYFDFSGYTDMAAGASLMLGIELPLNFDSPYKALSIADFWKRWHKSLTAFFTKYIYIPLGGSRKGRVRTYANIMIVFLVSGLWHGAGWTFILWGALYGLMMIFDRIFMEKEEKMFAPLRWMITFGITNIMWLLFRSESVGQWLTILRTVLYRQDINISDSIEWSFYLQEMPFLTDLLHIGGLSEHIRGLWMCLYLLSCFVICLGPENNHRNIKKRSGISMISAAVAFVWSLTCLSSESVFLYFNF